VLAWILLVAWWRIPALQQLVSATSSTLCISTHEWCKWSIAPALTVAFSRRFRARGDLIVAIKIRHRT